MLRYSVEVVLAGGAFTVGWHSTIKKARSLAKAYESRITRIYDKVKHRYFDSRDGFWRSTVTGKSIKV